MNDLTGSETADRMAGAVVDFMLRTVDSAGVDLPLLLRRAGLPPVAGKGREIRFSDISSPAQLAAAFQALVYTLCELSPQEGVDDSPAQADIDLFCYCLINCETLADVIDRAIRFTRISNDRWGGLGVERVDTDVTFSLDSRRGRNSPAPFLLDVCSLAFFYKLFSWLIAEPLRLQSVRLVHRRCAGDQLIKSLFDCSVLFGADQTALLFDAQFLRKPVVRTYNELSGVLSCLPIVLLPLPKAASTRGQVEMVFSKAIDSCQPMPSLERVASKLGQSISTLRRNLLRENTSFQEIADRVRMQRALQLLGDTTLTLDEISSVLGFSASSVFSRAFKGWTGQAPSAYRRAVIA